MRSFAALSVLTLCLFSLGHAQTTGAPAPIPSLAGTVWTSTLNAPQADGTTLERFYECEFFAGNRLRCEYSGTVLTNGTWFQNERLFRMDFNDGYSSWLGAIEGDRIIGNSVNKLGHKWTWVFARKARAAAPTPTGSSDSNAWIKYSDSPGRFSVLMPVAPVKSEHLVDKDGGKITNNIFMAKTAAAAFALSYADYTDVSEPEKVLERVRDGAINGIKGKLVSSTEVSHRGFPGLEFQASLEGALYTSRIYLVKARLYQMVVVAAPGTVTSTEINRYLTSFDLSTDQ